MVSPPTLALFAAASLLLVIMPGPNHVYIIARSVAQGTAAGVASAFGVETGTMLHILAAAAGLSYLVAQSVTLFTVVKLAGAAYLIYLGVRALTRRGDTGERAPAPQPLRRVYVEGVVVNVLNPKVILFFLAFLPQFVDPEAGSAAVQIVVLGSVLLLFGLVSDLAYAVGIGALGARLRVGTRLIGKVSGVVYLGLGLLAVFGGSRG